MFGVNCLAMPAQVSIRSNLVPAAGIKTAVLTTMAGKIFETLPHLKVMIQVIITKLRIARQTIRLALAKAAD